MRNARLAANIAAVLLVVCPTLAAQDAAKAVQNALEKCMNAVREDSAVAMPSQEVLLAAPKSALALLAVYQKDTVPKVRHFAALHLRKIAKGASEAKVRRDAVALLVQACFDPEPLVWQHAGKSLLDFTSDDFDADAKALIEQLVSAQNPRREDVRLAGIAQVRSLLPRLEELLIDETSPNDENGPFHWFSSVGWAARLARARMGVDADVQRCIELVQAEADPLDRVTVLLYDLSYTLHPAALTTVKSYVSSTSVLPQAKEWLPGLQYREYAIDALASYVQGFPVPKRYPGDYTEEDFKSALEWFNNQ